MIPRILVPPPPALRFPPDNQGTLFIRHLILLLSLRKQPPCLVAQLFQPNPPAADLFVREATAYASSALFRHFRRGDRRFEPLDERDFIEVSMDSVRRICIGDIDGRG